MANDLLRAVPLFADLSESDLDELCSMLTAVRLEERETLFCEGDPGDCCYVIQSGELEIFKGPTGREVLLAVRGPGDVIGEMALFEDATRMASARSRGKASLLSIEKSQIDSLLQHSVTAARAMFHNTIGRWRQTVEALRQNEKMAQLGTMSAGIAHELNNPAAAVQRGTGQLRSAIETYALATAAVRPPPTPEMVALVRERGRRPLVLDALARSDAESAGESWLEARGVPRAWELAPQLVALGLDLEGLAATLSGDELASTIQWISAAAQVEGLLAEIAQGASRVSEIVMSLKKYSYLDQAPAQDLDIHEGLESTLVMLRGKLKGVEVDRRYAPDLPRVHGWGSELNQVWTNLLDNAADALDGKGHVTVRTRREGDWVVVEVEDDGPGIPAKIQDRVFDLFFTTKPVGKGTGIGLDVSWRIVVDKHRGALKLVRSRPGSTVFQAWLPLNPAAQTVAPTRAPRWSEDDLRAILQRVKTIAVVGIRAGPEVPAHTVPAYLQSVGYRVIPVNPSLTEVLGEKAWPDLRSVPEPVDLVLVFRRSDAVPQIVDDAVAIGAKVVWMQEGIRNDDARVVAEAHGLQVVMDTCIRSAHRRMVRADGNG
jgi:predicted CoA-binding protein/signal transduction histidine kinase